jgi:L-iditol 2-dehydrogenase
VRAAVLQEPGVLRVVETRVPDIGPGEVLVRVEKALTCGTDVKMYLRGHPLARLPMVIGHEFVGRVVEVGEGVSGFRKNDRVVAANTAPCGACHNCLRGRPNLCERLNEHIIGFTEPGAYAEYLRVPARIVSKNMYKVPGDLDPVEAAFLEPLSCVMHALERARPGPGESVAVVGGGPMGLLLTLALSRTGATHIILVDKHRERLEMGLDFGATHTVLGSGRDAVHEVLRLTGGRGADLVFEAVGRVEAWIDAFGMSCDGGRVILFGGCPAGTTVSLDTYDLHYREKQVLGCFHHTPHSVREAWHAICTGTLRLGRLVTHRYSLGEVEDAIKAMSERRAMKTVITP